LAVSRSSPRISAGTPNLASIRLPGAQNGQKSALVMRFRRDRGLRGSDNFSGRIFPPISGIQGPRRSAQKFAAGRRKDIAPKGGHIDLHLTNGLTGIEESMQSCGVHYDVNATASSSFAGRKPG
jgi:hypothetical protein